MLNKKILWLSIFLVITIIVVAGTSYAFFTATVSGSETASTITITGGTMTIKYAGVSTGTVQTPTNIYPRADAWVTKNFTVTGTNTTAATMAYQIVLKVSNNTFTSGALKYTLTGTNTGNNGTIINVSTQTDIATGASNITLGGSSAKGTFVNASNKVHTYTLYIYFPNTNASQNADQGKSFAAYVTINSAQAT